MLFLTTYRVKPYLPHGPRPRSSLTSSARWEQLREPSPTMLPPTISVGWVVVENEDAVTGYAASLSYSEYIEFDTKPILTIEDALPHLLEAYQ